MVCLEIVDTIVYVGLTLLFNQDFQSRINDSLDPPIRTYEGKTQWGDISIIPLLEIKPCGFESRIQDV